MPVLDRIAPILYTAWAHCFKFATDLKKNVTRRFELYMIRAAAEWNESRSPSAHIAWLVQITCAA